MSRLQGDLVAVFPYLKGTSKIDGDRLVSRACCHRQGVVVLN